MSMLLSRNMVLTFDTPHRLSILDVLYVSPDNGRALYRVSNEHDGLTYTLKVFELGPKQAIETIRAEFVALNRQNQHPECLPRMRGVELHEGKAYVLLDWMDGKTLHDIAAGTSAATREDLLLRLAMVQEICKTLALIHKCGTVHRDLKPQNVLLKNRNNPAAGAIFIDFGLASLSRSDGTQGTIGYAAPEQVGARHLNLKPQTDIFAIGQILCYLLLGAPLLLSYSKGDTRWPMDIPACLRQRAAMPLPEDLIALMAQCLEFVPERRPAQAQAVQNRLKSIERSCA